MGAPISIRLDDDVRDELEAQARRDGVGLSAPLREVATRAARDVRRARIRAASEHVAAHVAGSAEGRTFHEDWGTPRPDVG